MRLFDKLVTLVTARLRARPEARAAAMKEIDDDDRARTGLDAAERRRTRLEQELAQASETANAVEVARIEAQIAELDRSERQLRDALGLIGAATASTGAEPEPMAPPGESRLGSEESALMDSGAAGPVPGQDADLSGRIARLSAPPARDEPKAET